MSLAERFGVYDFGLAAAEEERAARLHRESIVVDMLFQGPCGRRAFTDALVAQARAEAGDGGPVARWAATVAAPVRAALRGECDDFYDCWRESGITAGNRQVGFGAKAIALAQAQFDTFPWLRKALAAGDIRRANDEARHAGFLSAQDVGDVGAERDLDSLRVAHDFGVRLLGLSYNLQNSVAGGATERFDAGVTHYGAKVIAAMNALGIVIDLSHSSRQAALDAAELSEHPIVASHTAAVGVYRTDRAKSDEELTAIASTGGVVGVFAVPYFLAAEGATIETMLDHVDYVARLIGPEHVAIGTDWPLQADEDTLREVLEPLSYAYGFREEHNVRPDDLPGFSDYRDFPNVTRGLVKRGYSDDEIRGILGENFLRVFEAVCG